jgi:hypothetical protein
MITVLPQPIPGFMRNVLYNPKIRWTVWALLIGILGGVFYTVLHELYSCHTSRGSHRLQSDRLEESAIVSLDNTGNSYRIFAQRIQAQNTADAQHSTQYSLDLPKAVLHTPKQQCEIYSKHGTLSISKDLKPKVLQLSGDVTLHNTHLTSHYTLHAQNAHVDLQEKKIMGHTPIQGCCDYGTFSGTAFVMDKQAQNLTIQGPCTIHFKGYHSQSRKTQS